MQAKLDDLIVHTESAAVLISFSASWCGLCRMVEPILGRLQQEWQDSLLILQIDVDHNFLLAHHYKIKQLPTVVLLQQGREVDRISHFSNREQFMYQCEGLLAQHLQFYVKIDT